MNHPDKVIGYLEYLAPNGTVRERIPYEDAEIFKKDIYESLYAGEPVTPVIFPDELDVPLQFGTGTVFPWGFRSEEKEMFPYEIYQTESRNYVFMPLTYAKSRMAAADYKRVYSGNMYVWESLEELFTRHNRDDRPNAQCMRSMSVSDIVVTQLGGASHAYYVDSMGFANVDDLLPGLEKQKSAKHYTGHDER